MEGASVGLVRDEAPLAELNSLALGAFELHDDDAHRAGGRRRWGAARAKAGRGRSWGAPLAPRVFVP
jgi:hypothetical protein